MSCNQTVKVEANFCPNCGQEQFASHGNNLRQQRDSLVFVAALTLVFVSVYWLAMNVYAITFRSSEHYRSLRLLSQLLGLSVSCIPLILGLTLRNQRWKVVLIVFGTINILIGVYWFVREIL